MLMDYHWPGNVRELENAIEHAFVLVAGSELGLFDLPVEIRRYDMAPRDAQAIPPARPAFPAPARRVRGSLKKDELLQHLHACAWNKAEVGRRVGLSRTAVWKYMRKWDIPLEAPQAPDPEDT